MALSKESIRKLKAVKAAILAEPELYDQSEFPQHDANHDCSTPCCIAGWAVWVNNPDPEAYNALLRKKSFGVEVMAKALEISGRQAKQLFSNWPEKFMGAWSFPCTRPGAEAGARFIDHFIRTERAA